MNDKLARTEHSYIERDPMADWEVMRQQAEALVKSRLLPRAVDTAEKAIAIIQTGRELGIGPMQALRSIHVIEGKPTMSAELMAGLVLARLPGSLLRVASTSNEECTVEAGRSGQQPTLFRFSIKDAQAAGLVGKDNWKKYPGAMLRARCLAMASRAVFPDATMGMLDPDEMGAVTTEHGEVLSFEPQIRAVSQTGGPITPHSDSDQSPLTVDAATYDSLIGRIAVVKEGIGACRSYQQTLVLRELLGSRAKPAAAQLTRDIQAARATNLDGLREIDRRWAHCDREVAKLEKEYPAPSAEASFVDEPDDAAGDPAEDFAR